MGTGYGSSDAFVQAVVDFEDDQDDLYNALYAGAINAARAFVADLTVDCRRVVAEAELAGVSYIDADRPSVYSVLDGLWAGLADSAERDADRLWVEAHS